LLLSVSVGGMRAMRASLAAFDVQRSLLLFLEIPENGGAGKRERIVKFMIVQEYFVCVLSGAFDGGSRGARICLDDDRQTEVENVVVFVLWDTNTFT
jgi:hypothetical protein